MSDEFSPTWEEWFWSTIFPNPASWVTDRSGESQLYLFGNLSFTASTVIASTAYQYFFGLGTSAEAIALHGSRFNAAGYAATNSPGLWNTLRVFRKAPPWMAAGAGSQLLEDHTDFYSRQGSPNYGREDPFHYGKSDLHEFSHMVVSAFNRLT